MFCGLEADKPLDPYPGGTCFPIKNFILDYRIMFISSQSTVSSSKTISRKFCVNDAGQAS